MNRTPRMPGRTRRTVTISPLTCLLSAVCMAFALVVGCSAPQQLPQAPALQRGGVISGFAVDSLSGQLISGAQVRLDSLGITETADAQGRFAVDRLPLGARIVTVDHPGYFEKTALFDLSVSEDSLFQRIHLMPKEVDVTCPANFDRYHTRLQEDFDAQEESVRLAILGMAIRGSTVTIRPLLMNQLNEVLFIPDQYGYYGQYEVELYDGSGRLLPFSYDNAPSTPAPDARIYTSRDILTIPPGTSERLSPIRLELNEEPAFGDQITARLRYAFDLTEPVRGSLSSSFPAIDADTLIAAGRQIEVKKVARLVALADLVRAQSAAGDTLAADSTAQNLLAADSLGTASAVDSTGLATVLDSTQRAAAPDSVAADTAAAPSRVAIIASTDSSALRMLADTARTSSDAAMVEVSADAVADSIAGADSLVATDSLTLADSLVLADSTIVADTLTAKGPMVVQEAVVIRTGYNLEAIDAWKEAQAARLVEPYCQILRRELVSETWTTTVQ